jgi:hypothetical protein
MGSEDFNSGVSDLERMAIDAELVAPIEKAKIGAIPNATDHGANRSMHAVFRTAMPKFAPELERLAALDEPANAKLTASAKDIRTEMGKGDSANYRAIYRQIMDTPALATAFSKRFELNEFAKPKVGHAFAQINDEFEKAWSDVDLWNFHFAGVIMSDGDAYVTLENLSVENSNATNGGWYFRLNDKSRDFHRENRTDEHVGKYPTTMLFQPLRDE